MNTRTPRRLRSAAIAIPMVVASALMLSACSGSSTATSSGSGGSDPYHVVIISGETGALQNNSLAMRAGVKAAVEVKNAAGGINGHKIDVTYLDDKSDPTQAATVFQQYLTSNSKPDLVVAGQTSNEALALVPLMTRQKIISVTAVQNPTLDDPAKYPYFFSNAVKATTVTDAAAAFLESKGAKSVAFVAENDALLQSVQPALEASLKAKGISLTVDPFDPAAIDTSAAFAKAKASGADWIYMDAVGAIVPRLAEGRIKAGADSIPTIGGASVASSAFLTVTTPAQRKNLYPILYPLTYYTAPADRSAAFNALTDKLGDLNKLALPINNDAYGWDYINIWGAAVTQAKSNDADKVKAALENLSLSGQAADKQPWIMWRTLFSAKTHFVQASPDEFKVAQVEDTAKDAMIVTK